MALFRSLKYFKLDIIMTKLKIIIKGEIINLCLPTLEFAKGDVWYKWLNKTIIIKNLKNHYRKLNNTKKKQEKFSSEF